MVCQEIVKLENRDDLSSSIEIEISISEDEKQQPVSDLDRKVSGLLSRPIRGLNRRNKEKSPINS